MTGPVEQDPTLLAIWTEQPLSRFSVYTQLQAQELWRGAEEIRGLLDAFISDGMFRTGGQTSNLNLVWGKFWLWVLGAYEVTRTMSQYPECFSTRLNAEIVAYKRQISIVRIPFAKLEHRGNGRPIEGELSVYSMDTEKKDVAFKIDGSAHFVRPVMQAFDFTKQLGLKDVLGDLRHTAALSFPIPTPNSS